MRSEHSAQALIGDAGLEKGRKSQILLSTWLRHAYARRTEPCQAVDPPYFCSLYFFLLDLGFTPVSVPARVAFLQFHAAHILFTHALLGGGPTVMASIRAIPPPRARAVDEHKKRERERSAAVEFRFYRTLHVHSSLSYSFCSLPPGIENSRRRVLGYGLVIRPSKIDACHASPSLSDRLRWHSCVC